MTANRGTPAPAPRKKSAPINGPATAEPGGFTAISRGSSEERATPPEPTPPHEQHPERVQEAPAVYHVSGKSPPQRSGRNIRASKNSPNPEWTNEGGWPVVPLAELAASERNSITDGPFGSKLKTEHYTSAGPRVIRLKNIGDGEFVDAKAHISEAHFATLQKHRVFPGDIVIAALGENPPRACVVPESLGLAIVKADCIRFKAGPQVLPKFLNYVLNGPKLRQQAKGIIHGVGRPRLNLGEIKALPIPVPPIAEQRRIVKEIEKQYTRLDAGVAALRRVQANLKRYRAAVLKAACEGRLVPTEAELAKSENRKATFETGEALLARILIERRKNWQGRGQYTEPATPDTVGLTPLPEGWTWARLEQLGVTYGGLTKNPKRATLARQLPYLRVANVYANELRLDDIECIGVADSELPKLLVRSGDLLIVEGNGSKDQIGRLAIWDGSIESCVHQNHLIKVRPVESRMSKWILHWLQSPGGRQFVELVASSTSGLFTLSVNKVGNLLIAVPSLAEQARIVAEVERRLSLVEELEAVVTANLQRATRLRQSILQRAFSGELVAQQTVISAAPATPIASIAAPVRLNRHFARALLSAEIVHRLHAEPTFGRIKHQKIFHLCEHIAQLQEIEGHYHREAAGPLDNRLIHANEAELKKQKWYEEIPREGYGHAYRPLAKAGVHRRYLEESWPEQLATVERLIERMRTWDTDRCEIFSTTYAAWNDLILWKQEPSDDAILREILERWHERKKRIPEDRWRKAIGWMRREGFAPTGFGQPTRCVT